MSRTIVIQPVSIREMDAWLRRQGLDMNCAEKREFWHVRLYEKGADQATARPVSLGVARKLEVAFGLSMGLHEVYRAEGYSPILSLSS